MYVSPEKKAFKAFIARYGCVSKTALQLKEYQIPVVYRLVRPGQLSLHEWSVI